MSQGLLPLASAGPVALMVANGRHVWQTRGDWLDLVVKLLPLRLVAACIRDIPNVQQQLFVVHLCLDTVRGVAAWRHVLCMRSAVDQQFNA